MNIIIKDFDGNEVNYCWFMQIGGPIFNQEAFRDAYLVVFQTNSMLLIYFYLAIMKSYVYYVDRIMFTFRNQL